MQELLRLVRLGRDPGALAQLQHRLVRGGQIPARARHEEPLLLPHLGQRRRERLLDRARQPRDVLPVQRSDRRDRAGVARGVAPALLDLRRADDDLVAELGDRPVRRPVTSHRGPRQARAASSVSGVSPSCETKTSKSASRSGRSTSSSACTASPPVMAAWNDVPQPVKRSRAPSGKRLSVGTCASHSGCAAIARLVCSPCTSDTLYTIERGDGVPTRHARQRPAGPHGRPAVRAVGRRARDAGRRLPLRDRRERRDRALLRAHVLQGNREAAERQGDRGQPSTRSAASSTPSPARSTRRTTSSARPSTATWRSTCSSTCSATRASRRRRSSARRA